MKLSRRHLFSSTLGMATAAAIMPMPKVVDTTQRVVTTVDANGNRTSINVWTPKPGQFRTMLTFREHGDIVIPDPVVSIDSSGYDVTQDTIYYNLTFAQIPLDRILPPDITDTLLAYQVQTSWFLDNRWQTIIRSDHEMRPMCASDTLTLRMNGPLRITS